MAKEKKPIYKRVWFWVLAIIVVIAVIGGSDDKKPESGGSKTSAKDSGKVEEQKKGEEEEQTEFAVGEIISYKDFDLIFENQRKVKEAFGDKEYLILDVTIRSKKDDFTFFGDIQGVTDGNEIVDDTIAIVEEDLGDTIMTAWTKTLNEEQKAKGYVAFDKDIEKIEIRSNVFKKDVISVILE